MPLQAPRPGSAGTYGDRDVRVVQMIARRRVPVCATAFGAALAPRAPRARADAHSHRTLATRAAPKPPPPGRPQSATGASCGTRLHRSSPAPSSPFRRRVRIWLLTALATGAYRQRQTRALRELMALRRPEAAWISPKSGSDDRPGLLRPARAPNGVPSPQPAVTQRRPSRVVARNGQTRRVFDGQRRARMGGWFVPGGQTDQPPPTATGPVRGRNLQAQRPRPNGAVACVVLPTCVRRSIGLQLLDCLINSG